MWAPAELAGRRAPRRDLSWPRVRRRRVLGRCSHRTTGTRARPRRWPSDPTPAATARDLRGRRRPQGPTGHRPRSRTRATLPSATGRRAASPRRRRHGLRRPRKEGVGSDDRRHEEERRVQSDLGARRRDPCQRRQTSVTGSAPLVVEPLPQFLPRHGLPVRPLLPHRAGVPGRRPRCRTRRARLPSRSRATANRGTLQQVPLKPPLAALQ